MNIIKTVIVCLSLIFTMATSFENPFKLVFTNGGALAVQQDSLIRKYKNGDSIPKNQLRDLKINWWVKTSYSIAPSNLILRQYSLIDLYEGTPSHKEQIESMVFRLSGQKSPYRYRTWAEGYTYWMYTREALDLWMNKFKADADGVIVLANKIDSGFVHTSYKRYTNNLFYPAPFGDLWENPLDSAMQVRANDCVMLGDTAQIMNVKRFYDKYNICYEIYPLPVGLNGHTEMYAHVYRIENDLPTGFKYYQGYGKKYKDMEAEWTDLLNPIRLLTIPFIWAK